MTSWTWATVTALAPLRLQLDGDSAPIPITPDSLVDPLTLDVGDRLRVELSDAKRIIVLGRSGGADVNVNWGALAAAANLIINGDFRVNQRGASSGTSLASGAYFLDRWKSLAATNAVTWTGDGTAGRVLTIPASKSIAQVIERTDVPAGDYTVAWTGSAAARVYNVGDTPPAYSSGVNQITVTLDGAADVVVEFGPGSLSEVAAYPGSTAYPFRRRRYADELERCRLDQAGKATSGSGWTTVSFPRAYAVAPVVLAAPEVTANQYSVIANVTTSGFDVGVVATAPGTFVAGVTVGWSASGIR